MPDYIVLIRTKPSLDAVAGLMRNLREVRRSQQAALVYFHGDGVDALDGSASDWPEEYPTVDWCVCRTSLDRRVASGALPSTFAITTLMTFYRADLAAGRIDSVGLGGSSCCRPNPGRGADEGAGRMLLEVGFAPDGDRQRRETLEMALGAAALELDASVLFHGDGLAHLSGDSARGWAQITDFGLLEMYAEGPGRASGSEIDVRRVDAAQAADLRTASTTILTL